MKTLKVYDDVHTSVKIAAATLGRTTTNIASAILRESFARIESGELKITALPAGEPEADEETETVEA